MRAVDFSFSNSELGAPSGWDEEPHGPCLGLRVYAAEDGSILSCWRPSLRERLFLLLGWRVWLQVVGGMPPARVIVGRDRGHVD